MEETSSYCKRSDEAPGPGVMDRKMVLEQEQLSSSGTDFNPDRKEDNSLNRKDGTGSETTVDQEQCSSGQAFIIGEGIIDECVADKATPSDVEDCDEIYNNENAEKDQVENKMSKRKLKKLMKRQKWLENKTFKRERERERKKAKKRALKEAGTAVPPKSKKYMDDPAASSIKVAIDLSFNHLMTEKDQMKLVKQVLWSYSANRKAQHPLQLYLTNFDDDNMQLFDERGTGYLTWNVHYEKETYSDAFGKENVVYLTSDSSNVLKDLDTNKAYIIGGLVDHNSHKGLCHQLAEDEGIAHAKLPICDYIKLASRQVLTVNHVYEILLRFVECRNWQKAFDEVIPKRKGVTLLNPDSDENAASDTVDENNESKQLENDQGSQIEENNANSNYLAGEEIDNNEGEAEQAIEPSGTLARACLGFDVLIARSIDVEIPINRHVMNLFENIDIRSSVLEPVRSNKKS